MTFSPTLKQPAKRKKRQHKKMRPRLYQPKPKHIMGGGMAYFSSPVAIQRGRGLGGLLASVARSIIPIFKKPLVQKGLKRLGKHALTIGTEALGNTLVDNKENISFRDELKRSAKQQAQALIKEIRAVNKSGTKNKKRLVTPKHQKGVHKKEKRYQHRSDIFN